MGRPLATGICLVTEFGIALPQRRSLRLKGFDYRQGGCYFVTVCTYSHCRLFGEICNGIMILNDLGLIVEESWRAIAQKRPNVSLDKFIVMPNYLHGIIQISPGNAFGVLSESENVQPQTRLTLKSGSLGATVGQFKGAVTKRAKKLSIALAPRIWQRNYYEHIIRNETSLNSIRAHICENPSRWSEDSLFVE